MESYPNPTPFIGRRSQAWKDQMAAVAHITRKAVQLQNKESLRITHNCFPFDKYRKWSLSDNGCELIKVRKIWYKEFTFNRLFINVDHHPSVFEQGEHTIGFITAFKLPERQYQRRVNQ